MEDHNTLVLKTPLRCLKHHSGASSAALVLQAPSVLVPGEGVGDEDTLVLEAPLWCKKRQSIAWSDTACWCLRRGWTGKTRPLQPHVPCMSMRPHSTPLVLNPECRWVTFW